MAKYTYKETDKSASDASWIRKLQRINPVSSASSHHTEIHFTEPKAAETQSALSPHVTFISASGKTHWYLKNDGGKYSVTLGSGIVTAQANEGTIAQSVIDDAVALNWIKPAQPAALVDDEGFKTPETRGGKRGRMRKGWQQ